MNTYQTKGSNDQPNIIFTQNILISILYVNHIT